MYDRWWNHPLSNTRPPATYIYLCTNDTVCSFIYHPQRKHNWPTCVQCTRGFPQLFAHVYTYTESMIRRQVCISKYKHKRKENFSLKNKKIYLYSI